MWFIPAVIATLAWGAADFFYKKGNDDVEERFSSSKTVIMVGLVMGLHVLFYYFVYKGVHYDLKNIILYLPVSAMYILSMAVGYMGLKYIEVSISSPISNSSGAITALMSFLFLGVTMNGMQLLAIVLITIGVFALSVIEKKQDDAELAAEGIVVDKKYRTSFLAIIFPVLYCIIDGMGTFLDGIYLDYRHIMSEDQANISYELTFLIVALVVWAYLEWVKKEPVLVFQEKNKGIAAILETLGQFFYVGAMASNAIVVAPMLSSYSIVTILLGRIFLKEKLSWKQYAMIVLIMVGIAILGFYDG